MTATRSRTVARSADVEIEVRRSRFLAQVRRVGTEEEARAVVAAARRAHHDARHHCSALVLGPDRVGGEVQRSHDDGEPAGTAGAPMLEVLQGRGLVDVVAVVTRWFGGVLLGAGGLVRAYGDAVRAACEEAGVQERALRQHLTVPVPHADAGRLENELRVRGVTVTGTAYDARGALLSLAVDPGELPAVRALLAEATGGAAEPEPTGRGWVDL